MYFVWKCIHSLKDSFVIRKNVIKKKDKVGCNDATEGFVDGEIMKMAPITTALA